MRFLLAAAAAFFMLTVGAGAQPAPLQFTIAYYDRQNPVEQQTPEGCNDPSCLVVNPTRQQGYDDGRGCAWDIDDTLEAYDTNATLNPGAVGVFATCQVMEWASATCERGCGRPIGIDLRAPTPSLNVALCLDPPGRCIPASPIYNTTARLYEYQLCARVAYLTDDLAIVAIPDSNGGRGVITTEQLRITNPTSKTIRKLSVFVDQLGWFQEAHGCAYYANDAHQNYPVRWSP